MSEIINPYINLLGQSGFKAYINSLIKNRRNLNKYQFSQNGIFKKFEDSASKYNKRISNNETDEVFISTNSEAATLYLYLNDVERKRINEIFKNHCFITYVSEEEQKVTAPDLPLIQIYTFKRGMRSRPWFINY